GANKIALQAVVEAPPAEQKIWTVSIFKGQAQLGSGRPNEPVLVLNQVLLKGIWDSQSLKFTLENGEVGGPTVALALSGAATFGDATPMLSLGIATNELSVSAAKNLWPAPIAPGARTWLVNHADH